MIQNKIVMVTEYPFSKPSGSSMRVKWQLDALTRKNFHNITLIDNYTKHSIKPRDCIIHAQQLTGRFFEAKTYISDLHGIATEETWHRSFRYPFYSWKHWAFRLKSQFIKKLENKTCKNAIHVVCASDLIYDRIKNIQSATIIRNAVKIDEYYPTQCSQLRVAVVGPFTEGTQNYDVMNLVRYVAKNLPNIEFVFIGMVDNYYKSQLNFQNTKFLGKVDNYIEALTSCSVLLSPYPDHSYILASKNKILEAGACQIAVITSESGSIGFPSDLVLIGKSKEDYVTKLIYLEDENVRKEYGKKIRSEIEQNYNADIEIQKLLKLYNELIH